MTITDEMVEVLLIAFLYYIEIVVYFQIKSTSFLIYFACIECNSRFIIVYIDFALGIYSMRRV